VRLSRAKLSLLCLVISLGHC